MINLGVITAGALVAWTGSNYPDLIIGTIAGGIVLNGARRILAFEGLNNAHYWQKALAVCPIVHIGPAGSV